MASGGGGIISSLINGVFGIGGQLIDWGISNRQQRQQNAYNQKQWERQNLYNSPSFQMQLFKNAGINPYMVAGHSNTSQAGAVAPAAAPTYHPNMSGALSHFVSDFQNALTWQQNLKNLAADEANKIADTTNKEATNKILDAQYHNILEDTILKHIQGLKGQYEYNKFFPIFEKKYQKEVGKLEQETNLLSLQAQNRMLENSIRQYWKDNNMKDVFEGERLSSLYGGKKARKYFNDFMPAELELLRHNRDYRARELFNLRYYGTPNPASISMLGVPIGAVHNMLNNTDYTPIKSFYDAGKEFMNNAKEWFKGLFDFGFHKRDFNKNPLKTTPTQLPYGVI